mmetsp:Transcript_23476/g.44762  ORF Transcript_23476/g.44762 Transcript_23476/m.44762 type:complete len:128 (+) Transcript_23476:2205-2588(+)
MLTSTFGMQVRSVVYFPELEEFKPAQFSNILHKDLTNVIGSKFRDRYGKFDLLSVETTVQSVILLPPSSSHIPGPPGLSVEETGNSSVTLQSESTHESNVTSAATVNSTMIGMLVIICCALFHFCWV